MIDADRRQEWQSRGVSLPPMVRGSHYWPGSNAATTATFMPNVVWQNTSSNATYCSAAAALKVT